MSVNDNDYFFGGILLNKETQQEFSSLFQSYYKKNNFKFYAVPDWNSSKIKFTKDQQKEILKKSKAISNGKTIQPTFNLFSLSNLSYSEHIYKINDTKNRFILDFCIYKTNKNNDVKDSVIYDFFIIAKPCLPSDSSNPPIFIYEPNTNFLTIKQDMLNYFMKLNLSP